MTLIFPTIFSFYELNLSLGNFFQDCLLQRLLLLAVPSANHRRKMLLAISQDLSSPVFYPDLHRRRTGLRDSLG